jgi:threonine synthase
VTIGEGDTPLIHTRRLGESLGIPGLYVKDESRNPTWSYKDRLAAVAVTKAVEHRAEAIVVATTGNHGAAAAAYAAAAGLRCVALTLASVPLTMKVLMQAYGAEVVALTSGPDRWSLMREAVAEQGWVPLSGYREPPVGSNPFGIDGYKTIAYEIHEDLGVVPDVVVVPTAYADGLTGILRGFDDLVALGIAETVPRMVAAEPLGPYEATLAAGADTSVRVAVHPSVAFSTATPVATYQGLRALRTSGGVARTVGEDADIIEAQLATARTEGLYLEAAAAVCVPVIAGLRKDGLVDADDTVVIVGTSSGLKDIDATNACLPDVPVIEPTLDALFSALEASRR